MDQQQLTKGTHWCFCLSSALWLNRQPTTIALSLTSITMNSSSKLSKNGHVASHSRHTPELAQAHQGQNVCQMGSQNGFTRPAKSVHKFLDVAQKDNKTNRFTLVNCLKEIGPEKKGLTEIGSQICC